MNKKLKINMLASLDDQLIELYNNYRSKFSAMLKGHDQRLTPLRNYINLHQNNITKPFINEDIRVKMLNILYDKIRLAIDHHETISILRFYQRYQHLTLEQQLLQLYLTYKNAYAQILNSNSVYINVKHFVNSHITNSSWILQSASYNIKVFNILQPILKDKHIDNVVKKYVELAIFSVLPLKNRIIYLITKYKQPGNVIKNSYPWMLKEIESLTPLLTDKFYTTQTKMFWILHDIISFEDIRYRCKICNKIIIKHTNVYSVSKGYKKYCSVQCREKDPEYIKNWSQSIYDTFGVDHPWKSPIVREQIETTMFLKYGVKYAAQSPLIYSKVQNTKIELYGNKVGRIEKLRAHFTPELINKIRNIFINKYGVDNPLKVPSVRKTCEETLLKLYGVRNIQQNPFYHQKALTTARKNGNISKPEEESYNILSKCFGTDNIIREYTSIQYPWCCDFYIKTLDLYIECNFHWTHGGHPFNQANGEDIKRQQILSEKAQTDKYYKAALITWTTRDVEKRTHAYNNNLNYLEIWNIAELIEWIKTYENYKQ